jgi:single-strand DNA-binding protein
VNEAQITVVGWLAQDPYFTTTSNGHPYLALRIGCTPRRFDRGTGQFQDLNTMFLTVHCWRTLAENVNSSDMQRGVPVVVTGRLRIREYERDGQARFSAEIEATTVGHDLTRGSAQFRPTARGGPMTDEDRQQADEVTDRWSLGGPADTTPDSQSQPPEQDPTAHPNAA